MRDCRQAAARGRRALPAKVDRSPSFGCSGTGAASRSRIRGRLRMRQISQDQAIRVAISKHEALKEREAIKKAKWDHEKRRSVYTFHAPLCVFCSEHRVGFWETATGADYDEWCGQCEIKPTDI